MSEPMTAEEAREAASDLEEVLNTHQAMVDAELVPPSPYHELEGVDELQSYAATLRAYADMKEREAEIEAAERERLAKAADARSKPTLMTITVDGPEGAYTRTVTLGYWIRSQGETK